MALHTMRIGSGVPRVAYLHGLLGQGKNLATIAKAVSATDPGVLIDLPNHGRSPWTSTFGYADWADARRRACATGRVRRTATMAA